MAETQVEFSGLNEQDQLALDSFRSIHGRPTVPRRPNLAGRKQTPKFLEDFAHLQKRLRPRLQSDAALAIHNHTSSEKRTERQHFCEACTVYLPAHEQDWRAHIKGVSHQCQLLSLCSEGELGHMPQGKSKVKTNHASSLVASKIWPLSRLLLQVSISRQECCSPSSSCSILVAMIPRGYKNYS